MNARGEATRASPASLVALVLSVGVLALAVNNAFFNWVSFTEVLLRRFLY